MSMSNTGIIVAQKGNSKAAVALSSLIHGLYEMECYAIARFVAKENKPPSMVILAPNIEPDFECLFEVQVPFQEDIRKYRFPQLGVVKTISGKVLEEHRTLPSKELDDAMSDYVDSMDLMTAGRDADGYAFFSIRFIPN
jgi:ATP-dependent DNA helicase 2 subunit 2